MKLDDTLLDYAIESGEVAPVPEYTPTIDLDEQYEDVSELIEARGEEIKRGVVLAESLEALADRYSQFAPTELTMESYQFTLGHILKASGLDIPVSLVSPSFEAAEADKKSIGEKAKGVIEQILKWIKEKLANLGKMFARLLEKVGLRKKKAEDDTAAAEKRASEHKAAGINVLGQEKHTAPADKDSKPKSVAVKPAPGWMIEGGKFSAAKVRGVLASMNTPEMRKLLQGDVGKTDDELKKHLADGIYRNAFSKVKAYSPGAMVSEYTVSVPELSAVIREALQLLRSIHNEIKDLAQWKEQEEKNFARGKSRETPEEIAKMKASFLLNVQNITEATSFANHMYTMALQVHGRLTSMMA